MRKLLLALFTVSGVCWAAVPVYAGFPCSLTCPADQTLSNAPGQCSQIVDYPAPTTNGGICGIVTCDLAAGSSFPVNVPPDTGTTVVCTSISGPTCSFMVIVNDDEAPVIDCPTDIDDTVDGPTMVSFTEDVTDNCPGVASSCDPVSESVFPIGTTAVNCDAQDASGNADSCEFFVDLAQFTPPPPPTGIEVSGSGCALNKMADNAPLGWPSLGLTLLSFIGLRLGLAIWPTQWPWL